MSIESNRPPLVRVIRKYSYYLNSIVELIVHFAPLVDILRLFRTQKATGTSMITLRRTGLKFEVRSAMDVWSVKETFIDRFYEKFGCQLMDGWVVVDIGGGIGDFSVFASYNFPSNTVYTFEPFPGSFSLLAGNLSRNRITNVQAFQEAIWSENGRLVLDMSAGEPVQFISRAIGVSLADNVVDVPCVSLEEMFERNGITHVDLLKVDAEGAEYSILLEAPQATLLKIDRIVMEYHDAITPHSHLDLTHFLNGHGYLVRSVENEVHPELGYLYAER
jgi:FkbM family methyltransferase